MSNDWSHIYLGTENKVEEAKPQRSTRKTVILTYVLGFAVIVISASGFIWGSTQNNSRGWQAVTPTTHSQPRKAVSTQAQSTLKTIPWDYSYENALATARRKNKPVLIDFYTDQCGICKKMDSETFVDPAVIDEAKNYVTIKINAEQRTDLATQYNVSKYPTFIIADGSGNVKYNEAGGYTPANFVRLLRMYR